MARKDFGNDLVVVRNCEEEEEMTISMTLPPAGRQRNMNRKKDEPIAKPLERIRRTVSSAYMQKAGKGKKKGPRKRTNVAREAAMKAAAARKAGS